MHDSFGARVRRHREQRGISLAGIADQTKLKVSLLEGLERDDISQWPAGIFRRAYVRAYANAIRFDPDAALREFLIEHPDPVEVAQPAAPSPRRLRNLVGSALGSLRRSRPAADDPQPAATHAPTDTRPTHAPDYQAPGPSVLGLRSSDSDRSSAVDRPSPIAHRPSDIDRTSDIGRRTSTPIDFLAASRICTELGRVDDISQVPPLLRDAAAILDARGLIVWVWDPAGERLEPALVHGYSPKVRARLRGLSASADNVTAAAFRTAAPQAVSGTDGTSGALAVPLLAPSACAGVLAIELAGGCEEDPAVRATAIFFAAILAQLVGGTTASESSGEADAPGALEAQSG